MTYCKAIGCTQPSAPGHDFCEPCLARHPDHLERLTPTQSRTERRTNAPTYQAHLDPNPVRAIGRVFEPGDKDSNPKDAAASGRLPMHMVPDTLGIYAAMAFAEGDSKYIAYNFRIAGVRVSVYVAALRRHLMKYYNGEWADQKTKVPHLASVAACTSILIDGHVTGIIVDDRPPAVDLGDCIEEAERIIAHVYEMNKAKRPVGIEYTQLKTPRVATLLGGLG